MYPLGSSAAKFAISCVVLLSGTLLSCKPKARSPSTDNCRNVHVRLVHEVTLGPGAGPASPHWNAGVIRDSEGNYFVAPTFTPWSIGVYNSSGRFLKAIGNKGGGPGELGSVHTIANGDADTLVVFDRENGRLSYFDKSGAFARSVLLPYAITSITPLSSGKLLLQVRSADDHITPLRILDHGGRLLKAFGAGEIKDPILRSSREIAATGDIVYAGHRNSYTIDSYGTNGKYLGSFRRQVTWFKPFDPMPVLKKHLPIITTLTDVAVDSQGHLLALVTHGRKDARLPPRFKSLRDRKEGAHDQTRLTADEVDRIADFYVDVINPAADCVIASLFIGNGSPKGFVGGSQLFAVRELESGHIVVDVWRMILNPATRKGPV